MPTGKIKKYTIWSSISNIMQLPVIYLFFKISFPPYSMYISTILFGNICVYIIAMHYAKLYYQLSISVYFKKTLLPLYITTTLVMGLLYIVQSLFEINSIWRLLSFIILSILLFILTFFIIGCTKEEKNLIFELKNTISNKIFHHN